MAVDGTIQHIDKASIHRICSGQQVFDLATAVKELVENSLDAGATRIDIRLKDRGTELIEVADNGTGVSPENYQGLTLKHYTSKISEFADLESLTTFGFRGESLSSLCALAKVHIVTKTEKEQIAVRLEFDQSGLIISQQNIARSVGTTVSLAKLFSPLPVRFNELSRNIRQDYSRLLSVLQGYALISNGVRFICSNENGRAGRITVVHTQENCTLRDNIVTLFGTKTAACMEKLALVVSDSCRVEGFVSRREAGCGRSSGDRQFLYVNGRPVDMPKIVRLLNELHRLSMCRQYPMFVLNFILPTTSYDVNVSPDKRKLFLHSEASLIVALRESLEKVYSASSQTCTINSVKGVPLPNVPKNVAPSGINLGRLEKMKDMDEGNDQDRYYQQRKNRDNDLPRKSKDASNRTSGRSSLDSFSFQPQITKASNCKTLNAVSSVPRRKGLPNLQSNETIQSKLTTFVSRDEMNEKTPSSMSGLGMDDQNVCESDVDIVGCSLASKSNIKEIESMDASLPSTAPEERFCESNYQEGGSPFTFNPGVCGIDERKVNLPDQVAKTSEPPPMSQLGMRELLSGRPEEHELTRLSRMVGPRTTTGPGKNVPSLQGASGKKPGHFKGETSKLRQQLDQPQLQNNEPGGVAGFIRQTERSTNQAKVKEGRPVIEFDLEKFHRNCHLSAQTQKCTSQKQRPQREKCHFAAATLNGIGKDGIEKESVLKAASNELEQNFNKADFKSMKVLGQFNLGFILAKINDEIFIIDQHASDEKYKFECLMKTTKLSCHPLPEPLELELSAVEEITVLLHRETFRHNGFDFYFNEDAEVGQRLQLSAVPSMENTVFGVGDVQELISCLSDESLRSFESPGACVDSISESGVDGKLPCKSSSFLPRPSRVRAMLASQACRSSVMAGDPLSKEKMEQIVSHLSELDSPWSCPHGRPTMRHLIDLSSL